MQYCWGEIPSGAMRKTLLRAEGMGILAVKTWGKVFHVQWAAYAKTLRWEHDSVFRRQQRDGLFLNGRGASCSPTVGLLHLWKQRLCKLSEEAPCYVLPMERNRRKLEGKWEEKRHTLECFLLFFLVSSIWHLRLLSDLSTCRTSLLHVLIGAATAVIFQGWRKQFYMAVMHLLPSMP